MRMRTAANPSGSYVQCHVSSGRHKIPATLPTWNNPKRKKRPKPRAISQLTRRQTRLQLSPLFQEEYSTATMLKFLLLCTLAVVSRAEIAEEEDVLVLKKSNFDEALKAHPNILVEFCE